MEVALPFRTLRLTFVFRIKARRFFKVKTECFGCRGGGIIFEIPTAKSNDSVHGVPVDVSDRPQVLNCTFHLEHTLLESCPEKASGAERPSCFLALCDLGR